LRFCFLGSPPFATPVLAHLATSRFRPELVVTPPPRRRGRGRKEAESELAELASDAGLALEQPESVRDPAFLDRLRAVEADWFLVVSYGELLREEFLELPREGSLNVHPSLLPRWRGATPIPATIAAGDEETGVSLQRVVLELDAGDVLLQKRTPVLPGETAGELYGRLSALSGELCVEAFEELDAGTARFTPQDPELVTHCKKLTKEDGHLDWRRPAVELERHVRAMNPWPGSHTALPDGKPFAVWRAHVVPGIPASSEPGTLVKVSERLLVATGEGVLELDQVQLAGKRALAAGEFLRGARLEVGQRLA